MKHTFRSSAAGAVLALLFSYSSGPPLPNFTSVSLSNLTFAAGSNGAVGTATTTVSSGPNTPIWSLKTSGVDSVSAATCNNYSAYFTIGNTASTAPGGPTLTTSDGIWSWGTANGSRPGEYNLNLNGAQAGIGTFAQVFGGQLYVNTLNQGWYLYNNGFGNSASPAGQDTTGIVSVNSSAPVQNFPGTCLQATQAGVGNSPYSQAFTVVGSGVLPPTITSVVMSNLNFTAGVASNIGTATATVSSGANSPTWSIKTSGVDSATSATCNNYSFFSINSSTGVVSVNSSAPAQSYPGTCIQATQAADSNSPYSKAFTFVGASSPAITSVSLSCDPSCTYTSGVAPGTVVGMANATLSSGSFVGAWSTGGPSGGLFTFSGNQLLTNSSTPTCVSPSLKILFAIATQSSPPVSNSPYQQAEGVTCNPSSSNTIASVSVSPSSFIAQSGDANSTVGSLSTIVSNGSFGGTYALATSGACTGMNNSSFAISDKNLNVGGSDITTPASYALCVQATDPNFANSPFFQAINVTGLAAQTIAAVTPSSCSFTAGTQNGAVCALSVTMNPSAPGSTAAITLTGANSGGFHLVGAGCANISAGTCTIEQSASVGGTPTGTYTDVSAVATQGGIGNSPFTQALRLTGTSVVATISSVGSTNTFFSAQSGNAGVTIGTLSASVTSGSFAGTFALATSGACTGADNASFAIAGSTLKVGGSDVTSVRNYSICVRTTDANYSNSPAFFALTLTGTGVGAVLTTDTYINYSGGTLPAGTPVSFGKAFRYGDIMPGTHPVIRDASTHTPLAGQQWDEISTWRENGGNSSWRHAVWAAWLPSSLANGASFQVEYVVTAGAYSETSHQALSVLCSGPAAHDLKIHLANVTNQDDTVRDSGDATFRLCDNIANVGRDAPRHIRAGNVYDEYVVSGLFVYATSGNKDPQLYGVCNVDIFTKASDGTSPGDVRWVCEPSNSWMNVTTGSAGNAGNPGPVGFTGDPQTVFYRPEVLDGAVSVLNWSGLDATISSASNPIQPASSVGCYTGYFLPGAPQFCMNVPTATGVNSWYSGQALRASCSGSCPAGITNNKLYYVSTLGEVGTNGFSSTEYALLNAADMTNGNYYFMTSSQGSGTTSFSFRVAHYHWTTIPLLDQTGLDNWSPFGTTTRVTRKVYPAFTSAEKLYWEQTGLIIPLNLSGPAGPFTPSPNNHESPYYTPNGAGTVQGGNGPGDRPDLGIISEWSAQAFILGGEANWDYERLFTLGGSTHGPATILNEATGRIPAINNGPPTGPGGNGNGGSYAGLGAPMNNVSVQNGAQGMVDLNYNVPAGFEAALGQWTFGTAIDHMPSFTSIDYEIFGDRHLLDFMRWQANRPYTMQRTGPGPELGQGYLRDNFAKFTDGNIYHYYGILYDCCQGRGYAWMIRDITYPAAFGGDSDIERSYFNDFLVESRNYYPMWLNFKNGPSQDAPNNSNYSNSIAEPGGGGGEGVTWETFIQSYVFDAAFHMVTFLHEPLGSTWMTKYQRYFEGNCGARLAGALPYYCADYYYSSIINNGADGAVTSQQGSTGLYANGVDAQDFGITTQPGTTLRTGGQWGVETYIVTPGDQVMAMWGYHIFFANGPIDQLPGNRYFSIIGPVDNTPNQTHTFYIQCTIADHAAFPSQCPVAGQAFTGFTRGGVPIQNEGGGGDILKYRLSYDPGAGGHYSSPNYEQYMGQDITGLGILGYNVAQAKSQAATRGLFYNSSLPINNWDPTVVIPGLPTAVNSIP